jgi:hypothetical protein
LTGCRPGFALKLLECIKHLFAVDGMVFVLAMDRQQLRSSVGAIYGTGIDAEDYLRRFIDWTVRLPLPNWQSFASLLADRFQFAHLESFSGRDYASLETLTSCFATTAKALGLSSREQEQAFSTTGVARTPAFYLPPVSHLPTVGNSAGLPTEKAAPAQPARNLLAAES